MSERPATTQESLLLIEHQIKEFAARLLEVSTEMKTLVILNERQTAILEKVTGLATTANDHEGRLREIEKHQPGLRETRGWVIAAGSAVISAACAALVSLLVSGAAARAMPAVKPPAAVVNPAPQEQTNSGR